MRVYDFAAIGLGPFNLGLACLTDPIEELDGVFLERKPAFDWHPGMLLPDASLQTPFLSDLVTLADPTSPYSFLAFLKQAGRLYSFYIRENFFPLRQEYADYCRWAANQLRTIRYGREVTAVSYDAGRGLYRVRSRAVGAEGVEGVAEPHVPTENSGRGDIGEEETLARRVVIGVGSEPAVPACCEGLLPAPIHSADYLRHRDRLRAAGSVTVVGSGQSAAEIFHDLLQDIDGAGYRLTWITRSPRFFPLEYTKLTLEMTSPDYTDYFHRLPAEARDRLNRTQHSLYKGVDSDLINAIFDLLYQKNVSGHCPTRLLTNTELAGVAAADGGYRLRLHQREQDERGELDTDELVLATGYRYRTPEFLDPIADRIAWQPDGRYAVARNYSIDTTCEEVFVQNGELHTHGFVAPDLGMGAYRNSYLIAQMLGREYYPVEKAIAFQDFGIRS